MSFFLWKILNAVSQSFVGLIASGVFMLKPQSWLLQLQASKMVGPVVSSGLAMEGTASKKRSWKFIKYKDDSERLWRAIGLYTWWCGSERFRLLKVDCFTRNAFVAILGSTDTTRGNAAESFDRSRSDSVTLACMLKLKRMMHQDDWRCVF